jgi:hypothetical protein
MQDQRRRELKSQAKEALRRQHEALLERLHDQNPYPLSDPRGIANYREIFFRNQQYRSNGTDVLLEAVLGGTVRYREWTDPPQWGKRHFWSKGWYVRCCRCRSLVPTAAVVPLSCPCANVNLDPIKRTAAISDPAATSIVSIEPQGSVRAAKSWWKFW